MTGAQVLLLTVHLLLSFSTFYSVILFILKACCHHLSASQASGANQSMRGCSFSHGTVLATLAMDGAVFPQCLLKLFPLARVIKPGKQTHFHAIELAFLSGLPLRYAFKEIQIDLISNDYAGREMNLACVSYDDSSCCKLTR